MKGFVKAATLCPCKRLHPSVLSWYWLRAGVLNASFDYDFPLLDPFRILFLEIYPALALSIYLFLTQRFLHPLGFGALSSLADSSISFASMISRIYHNKFDSMNLIDNPTM